MHTHADTFDFGHILLHTVQDTAKMLPFLFLAYLVIELIERKKSHAIENALARGGRWGFVAGALLGLLPQCGFSAMAANFYSSRVITLGTLLAVFLSTSDEAIPIMLAQPQSYGAMLKLILFKLGFALVVGFVVDVVLRRALTDGLRGGYRQGPAAQHEVDCHHHHEKNGLLLATAKHTASIFITVFLFTLAFGVVVGLVGEGRIAHFLAGLGLFQPAMAAAFGLIPNCASSVMLTQLYLGGSITFGSVLAGLCANAGVGVTVLFRTGKSPRRSLAIVGLLWALGTAFGTLVQALKL